MALMSFVNFLCFGCEVAAGVFLALALASPRWSRSTLDSEDVGPFYYCRKTSSGDSACFLTCRELDGKSFDRCYASAILFVVEASVILAAVCVMLCGVAATNNNVRLVALGRERFFALVFGGASGVAAHELWRTVDDALPDSSSLGVPFDRAQLAYILLFCAAGLAGLNLWALLTANDSGDEGAPHLDVPLHPYVSHGEMPPLAYPRGYTAAPEHIRESYDPSAYHWTTQADDTPPYHGHNRASVTWATQTVAPGHNPNQFAHQSDWTTQAELDPTVPVLGVGETQQPYDVADILGDARLFYGHIPNRSYDGYS